VISGACPRPTGQDHQNVNGYGADLLWTDPEGDLWDLYIVPSGTAAPDEITTPTIDNTTDNPYNWAGGAPLTAYDWYVRRDCEPELSLWKGPDAFTTTVSCLQPTALNANGITAHTANLMWTPGATESSWEYVYGIGLPAPLPGDPGIPTTSSLLNPISGLTESSSYQFYVKAICGAEDFSVWSGPYSFMTLESCPEPTQLTVSNITETTADVSWVAGSNEETWNVQVGHSGFVPGTGTETVGATVTVSPSWTADPLEDGTDYDAYVQAICGFDNPKQENFWIAIDEASQILTGLDPEEQPYSGGSPVDEPGEDGIYYFYQQTGSPWYNVWFYNGPLDLNRMKNIRMGFWAQSLNGNEGSITYVVNWSNNLWNEATFPSPEQDIEFIERSTDNGPVVIGAAPQWFEVYYVIPDYNPRWVSVDLYGVNVQIVYELTPPPDTSALYSWWQQNPQRGGILLHECLPKPVGDLSSWTGPFAFATSCSEKVLPICESFDGEVFAPACWLNQKTAGTSNPGTWARQTTGIYPTCSPNSGSGMAYYNSFNYSSGTAGILVSPSFTLPAPSEEYFIKFWMYRDPGYSTLADRVNVYLNSTPDLAGATLLGTINRSISLTPVVATEGWYPYSFALPAGQAGTGQYIVVEGVSVYGNNIFVDDICIIHPCINNTWTGMISSEWQNPANWSCMMVPDVNTNVVIPAPMPGSHPPVIEGGYQTEIWSLELLGGTNILVQDGSTLIILHP
jgi:hypothetical protein